MLFCSVLHPKADSGKLGGQQERVSRLCAPHAGPAHRPVYQTITFHSRALRKGRSFLLPAPTLTLHSILPAKLGALTNWYGAAVLPRFSTLRDTPIACCGLPASRVPAPCMVAFPLRLSHAHARLEPHRHPRRYLPQRGRTPTRSFQRALSFSCGAKRYAPTLSGRYPASGEAARSYTVPLSLDGLIYSGRRWR